MKIPSTGYEAKGREMALNPLGFAFIQTTEGGNVCDNKNG